VDAKYPLYELSSRARKMAAATRVVRSLLYEISPLDPVTFGGVGSMLMTVALLAALLPAVRAATMDPAEALRND